MMMKSKSPMKKASPAKPAMKKAVAKKSLTVMKPAMNYGKGKKK